MARKKTHRSRRHRKSDSRKGSPAVDHGSDREGEEGPEDELDNFRRRAEWWRDYHGDASGVLSDQLRLHAIDRADQLASDGLPNPDPGGGPPKSGFEIVSPPGTARARAQRARNPRPNSSLGFASDAVELHGPAELSGAVLKIALDRSIAASIEPETIRVFALDPTTGEWQLIPRSGVSPDASYVWAHVHRPGLYVAIGLRADAQTLVDVLTIRALMPKLRAATTRKDRRDALKLIETILPRSTAETNERRRKRVVSGLELSDRGLPEFDLLDELHSHTPRPPGKSIGAEIISRLRLNDLLVDVDNLIWFSGWSSVGPRNFSGRIKSLSIHPVEGLGVLAGAADGGVWRTSAGGPPWYPLMSQEKSLAIGSVARSSADLSVIYAATGEDTPGWGPSYGGVGVYKSVDGGGTWTLLAPISSRRCTRVLIHPDNADIVYVSGNGGLHKSIDGGASWTNVRTDHVSDMVMDPAAPNTIYAGVWMAGVFRTTNGGSSWSDFNQGLPTGGAADWIKLAASEPAADGVVTLAAKMGADSGQVFTRRVHVPPVVKARKKASRSLTDLSDVLFPFPFPDPPWELKPGTHEPASYNEWTNFVALDPRRPRVIFVGGVGLQRSADGGANFAQITGTHSDHHEIVFAHLNNDVCYMATDGGVFRSVDNGVTWSDCSSGLVATQLYSIGVGQTGSFLLGGATQDQGVIATTGSADWFNTGAGNEGGFFIVDPNNSNNVYATPWSGNLRRSTNGGTSWTTILDGITQTGDPPAALTVSHLAVCPTNSNLLLCCAGSEVFRSTDQGTTWSSVFAVPGGAVVTRVAWYGIQTCYATTATGEVFRSQQQGNANSWSQPYTTVNAPPHGRITSIEIRFVGPVISQLAAGRRRKVSSSLAGPGTFGFPFRQDLVYIAYSFGGRVYRSTDGGAHWSNASGTGAAALPNIPVSALVIDKDSSDTVYVATDIGVFRTRDSGEHWEPFSSGLPRIVVSGLTLRRASNTLYVSTMGRGAYHRPLY